MVFRDIAPEELSPGLFRAFRRHQAVGYCWRKTGGAWRIMPDPFIDDWDEEDHEVILHSLRSILSSGGWVHGVFLPEGLKGFAAVENRLFGSRNQYMDLSFIYVSEEMRGQGIGRRLFSGAMRFARACNAEKLYVSAHSAVESIAFYRAMGSIEAEEYDLSHVMKEPYDLQLECLL